MSDRPTSHCPVKLHEKINDLEISSRLGRGRFATVWKCSYNGETQKEYAIKIYRAGEKNEEYYCNEIKILNKFSNYMEYYENKENNIIKYVKTFIHIVFNEDLSPIIHPCIVFELYTDSLSNHIRQNKEYKDGFPQDVVKKIMKDIFNGLVYLHDANIIHTDIKPSNLLIDIDPDKSITDKDFSITIADLGSSTSADVLFSDSIGTVEYCAPESIINEDYSFPVDIWATFVTCFELLTGELIFDIFSECNINYGSDISRDDSEDMSVDYDSDSESSDDSDSESSSSSNKSSHKHLMLIEKVLGKPPTHFTSKCPKYYTKSNKLRNSTITHWISIGELLKANYNFPDEEVSELETFLSTGLKWNPNSRITAMQAVKNKWINCN
jgi:serine/threonine protein kinase